MLQKTPKGPFLKGPVFLLEESSIFIMEVVLGRSRFFGLFGVRFACSDPFSSSRLSGYHRPPH